MKLDDHAIEQALERRLSGLRADPARRARIRESIKQAEEEPIIMKRKLSVGLVLALAAALAVAGAALALGLNLFEHFSGQDQRYAEIAPLAEITPDAAARVETDALGTTKAAIVNAYFDGDSLLVGYRIENATRTEAFTPTTEQLARMTPVDASQDLPLAENDTEAALCLAYAQAVAAGTPFGLAQYAVYPSDHTETDDGIDLPPLMETDGQDEDGARLCIREYEAPLPEEVRARDVLNLRIRLYTSVHYLYFDGQTAYELYERQEAGAMTATVRRVAGESAVTFAGEASLRGASVTVTVTATAMRYTADVTASSLIFEALPEDTWYDLRLTDEAGRTLRVETIPSAAAPAATLTFTGLGTGIMPQCLTADLLRCAEGGADEVLCRVELVAWKQ